MNTTIKYYHLMPDTRSNDLCSILIKSTLSKFPEHSVIIYTGGKNMLSKYVQEKKAGNFSNELLVIPESIFVFPRTQYKLLDFPIRCINKVLQLIYRCWRPKYAYLNQLTKNDRLIVHGELLSYKPRLLNFIAVNVPHYSWVCWGNTDVTLQSKYQPFISKLSSVVTLMLPDKEIIEQNCLHLRENIYVVPYISSSSSVIRPSYSIKTIDVLLGNNACYLGAYEKILPTLVNIGCSVNCMVAYGNTPKAINQFKEHATSLLKEKICYWEKLIPIEEYLQIMQKHHVYLSPVKRQTGLGAIYYAVFLGLKLYLAGNNYEWLKHLGLRVHHIDELQDISCKELTAYSSADREFNIKRLKEVLDVNYQTNQWKDYFDEIK